MITEEAVPFQSTADPLAPNSAYPACLVPEMAMASEKGEPNGWRFVHVEADPSQNRARCTPAMDADVTCRVPEEYHAHAHRTQRVARGSFPSLDHSTPFPRNASHLIEAPDPRTLCQR